jgi:hypothetical protein
MVDSQELAKSFLDKKREYMLYKSREFRKNSEWIADEREKLRRKYPNMYIAVRNRKVIAKNKNLSLLLSEMEKLKENEDIVIDYISLKRLKLIL